MKRWRRSGRVSWFALLVLTFVVLVAGSFSDARAQGTESIEESAGATSAAPSGVETAAGAQVPVSPASGGAAPSTALESTPYPSAPQTQVQAKPAAVPEERSAGGAKTPSASAATVRPSAPARVVRNGIASGGSNGTSPGTATPATETAQALRVVLGLTVLAVLPALLVCLTSFLRIIVVLSMLRHAIGMNETPPNTVLIGLALFLTLFTMSPVLQKVNQDAFEPFMAGKLSMEDGYGKGVAPLREFMVRQTREADLALMVELSKAPTPKSMEDISNVQLIPSFMLSELRAAFQIGFVIFLPFLLIDLLVSSILMALGMMMMPPTTIALPLKILMFILVDGWSLVLKALVGSFH
ncbi:flagellar type III secretion system pore protein FliP [Variovorax boronicumulans]|uniref:flagellar type III secretion system pore protein FliP n=1 Tax=Variovorax boronicumulans TaxID=436515 RepID=UPI00277ECE1A|nr:flagellar type III secretion system pore protein FliP [Variovorax boronicumulans]MDQ0045442.1 flagellar biosynthetic protein FliP [Variovorax boronicumulans]